MSNIDQWIAEAEARCEAATKEPWTHDDDIEDEPVVLAGEQYIAQTIYDRQSFTYRPDPKGHVRDAEFIAHARTDLPRALRLIRRYRETMAQISANEHRANAHDAELHLPWCVYPDGGCFCAKEAADRALAYTGKE